MMQRANITCLRGFIRGTLIALVAGCAGLQIEQPFRPLPSDWTMYGGALSRSNQTAAVLTLPLTEAWQYNSTAGIAATPLVRDSVIIVCTLNGEIQAVDFATGRRIGYSVLESSIAGTPALNGTNLFVPLSSSKESFVCYNLHDGRKTWIQKSLGPLESSPLVTDQAVFVTTLDGTLNRLNKEDGEEIWKFSTKSKEERKPIRSSPATDGARAFFGCDDGFFYAVSLQTGELAWKYQTEKSIFASPIVAGAWAVVGSLDGFVYALDCTTGALGWRVSTGAPVYGSASTDGTTIFIGSSNGTLFALDARDGSLRWKFEAKSGISSAPLVSGTTLFFGSLDRIVYALETSTGKELWKYTAAGRVRVSPVLWGNALLVTSEDKFITCLRNDSKQP